MSWNPFKNNTPSQPEGPTATREEVTEKLKTFIATKSKLVSKADLAGETRLFSSGILDSLAFLELVVFAESQFHVKLSKTTTVTMKSLDRFEDLVEAVEKALSKKP